MPPELAAMLMGVWTLIVLCVGVTMGWRMKSGVDPLPSLSSIRVGFGNKEPKPEEKKAAKVQELL